ncbi:hypothetical protein SR187_8480 [Streptococcus ruminantium]|uniref:Uncharacterized protein n=1 Tax=Streptococcus ruminantium TaxID=1917441 RepID=A0A2Z5TQ69_9STRE|nr:hypothetical protein SR187_8480 [Streptococcus ruminantium]
MSVNQAQSIRHSYDYQVYKLTVIYLPYCQSDSESQASPNHD